MTKNPINNLVTSRHTAFSVFIFRFYKLHLIILTVFAYFFRQFIFIPASYSS